jgi:hypothetical protein
MACPEFELCSPDELRHYFKAIYRAEYNGDQLLPLLVDAARHNAKYRRFVIAVQHKVKTLRYQRRDVDTAKTISAALNSTGGCHERIRLQPP